MTDTWKKTLITVCIVGVIIIAAALGLVLLPREAVNPADYNVVLITLDTTRGDYIDTGNGARAFTPALKHFAQKSLVFEQAYSTIPQTLPAHLSILTSHYPHECGVLSNQYNFDGRHRLLQEVLKEKGVATAAVISLGTLASSTGIANGFDEFREQLNEENVFYATAERITHEALDLLGKMKKQQFFLFLHYSDPHSPYAPPRLHGQFTITVDDQPAVQFNAFQGAILRKEIPLAKGTHHIRFKVEDHQEDFTGFVLRRLQFSANASVSYEGIKFSKEHYGGSHVQASPEGSVIVKCKGDGFMKLFQVIPLITWKAGIDYYRQEVEYMDRQVGKFLNALEQENLLKKTIVVIVGDHGEGLGERERYFGHVRYLNRQFIEVPFMMYVPGVHAKHISTPVSQVNISPTILAYMGLHTVGFNADKSLIPLIEGKNIKAKPVYSFAFKPSALDDRLSVISWPYQCITSRDSTGTITREYYNFTLSQSYRKWDECSPDVLTRNAGKTFQFLRQSFASTSGAFSNRQLAKINNNQQDLERLKTIGYIQ